MKREKILRIAIILLLIIIFSIAIAVMVLKYNNKSNKPKEPAFTKDIAIKMVESNYDTSNMILDAEEREEYFIVYLKDKNTNEVVKSYSVVKKNKKIYEIHTSTVSTG